MEAKSWRALNAWQKSFKVYSRGHRSHCWFMRNRMAGSALTGKGALCSVEEGFVGHFSRSGCKPTGTGQKRGMKIRFPCC